MHASLVVLGCLQAEMADFASGLLPNQGNFSSKACVGCVSSLDLRAGTTADVRMLQLSQLLRQQALAVVWG
jgi:hypothetical protein